MTNKIVRKTLNETVFSAVPILTRQESIAAVDAMINVMFEKLVKGHCVNISGFGRIVPRFKKGGRPVRNPKTGVESVMKDRYSVNYKANSAKGLINPPVTLKTLKTTLAGLPLFKELQMKYGNKRYTVADEVVMAVAEQLINARHNLAIIELRGFGIFKTALSERLVGRNPKTGEEVTLSRESRLRTRFVESAQLRAELDKKLLEE